MTWPARTCSSPLSPRSSPLLPQLESQPHDVDVEALALWHRAAAAAHFEHDRFDLRPRGRARRQSVNSSGTFSARSFSPGAPAPAHPARPRLLPTLAQPPAGFSTLPVHWDNPAGSRPDERSLRSRVHTARAPQLTPCGRRGYSTGAACPTVRGQPRQASQCPITASRAAL